MKKKIIFFLISILIISAILVFSSYERPERMPTAEGGQLDLTEISIKEVGPISLAGEWYFSWEQWLDPSGPNNTGERVLIDMPSKWNGQIWNGESLSGDGYATYHINIFISEVDVGKMLGLYLPNAFTSYKVWVNGRQLGEAGSPGQSRERTVPAYLPQVVYFEPQEQEIDLVFHVANFHHSKGGLWRSIRLGEDKAITSLREKQLAFEMFLIGSLFVMGLYHLGLYILRRKEKSTLYFGLFCLVIGLRAMMVGEVFFIQVFPQFPWEWIKKIEYICFYIGVPLFVSFARQLYPDEIHKLISRPLWGIASLFVAFILVTPARIFTMTLTVYQIITVIVIVVVIVSGFKAMKNKRDMSALNFGVGIFYVLTVINDFLFYNQIIITRELSPFGLFIFLFAQSFHLSTQFSRAFSKVEEVTQQLQELNQNLEKKVEERTIGLEKSQKETVEALIEMSVLEERNRIAHEIHDITGHSLTTVIVQLEAGKRLSKSQPNEAFEKMKLSQELLRKGLQRIRESVRILGEVQETMNMEEALTMLIEDTMKATGVLITTKIEEVPKLNHAQKKVIYYALQEGLTNGIRHGNSTHFHFTLQTKGSYLQFKLVDNGTGMEKVEFGFGLSAMRNRIHMINGDVSLNTEKGKGCQLVITLPLDQEFSKIKDG
ncbi:7TM diverse intracellular signaling domain-containing protein [Alkalihalobacterium alkalinitrilicum]|uniref:7TM diverse intracellular signaling domain-containing protein n=1 Tax=Alkalihalobacterium alkalinitrilicum TaxID=427920 RepID=UPI000995D238|nr:7TM diverse intracellular signaling domain-containing protein [Alkalihalobacterium alkalinitrilicum]